MGESQDSHSGPAESPAARRKKASPSTAAVIPLAARAPRLTWAATAATPANTHPAPAAASPSAAAPARGRPWPTRPRAMAPARTPLKPRATSSAAASGARRPTAAAPTSSSRPASSSAREWRTTTSPLASPASSAAIPPVRQAVSPPTEPRSKAGPVRARIAGFEDTLVPKRSRAAAVGYSSAIAEAVPRTVPAITTTATGAQDPVALEREAHERGGAGEGAHSTVTASGRCSVS